MARIPKRQLAAHRAARDELLRSLDSHTDPADDQRAPEPAPTAKAPRPPKAARPPRERTPRAAKPERTPRAPKPSKTPKTETAAAPEGSADHRWRWWTAGWVLAAVGVIVAVTVGAPVLGHPSDTRYLIAGAAIVACGAALAAGHRPPQGRKGRTSVPVIMVLLAVFAVVGSTQSVVIDGRPVLTGSTQARAHDMVLTMEDDIQLLVEADELISLPIAEARARSHDYEDMLSKMQSLSTRWSKMELSALPTGEFAPLGTNLASASFAAGEAIDRKISLLGTTDARITAEMNSFRETLVAAVLETGPQLVSLGTLYDVDVTLGAPTVRE